jgi:hypothetical protein
MQEYIKAIFLLRVAERFLLTGIILAIALVVLIAFWRTVHRIEFNVTKDKLGVAGTTLIATPILVLLILVGFSWVALTNRISLEASNQPVAPDKPPKDEPPAPGGTRLSGAFSADDNFADTLLAFNCAVSKTPSLTSRQDAAINRMKANEIIAHWQANWGDDKAKEDFWRWATEADNSVAPAGDITRSFHGKDSQC